ncbi:MAG: ATP-binding protein [Sarcina sp.]
MNLNDKVEFASGTYIEIHDIGKVKYAKVDINNISVIIGDNDLGKSTICKVLYAYIKSFGDLESKMDIIVRNYLDELGGEEFEGHYYKLKTTVSNILNGSLKDDENLNLVKTQLFKLFYKLLEDTMTKGRVIRDAYDTGIIRIVNLDNEIANISINRNGTITGNIELSNELIYKDATFMDSTDWVSLYSMWQSMQRDSSTQDYISDYLIKLGKATSSDKKATSNINSTYQIDGVGNLVSSAYRGMEYKSEDGIYDVRSIGDGYRSMVTLLAILNSLDSKEHLLLIDEPESGLYQGNIEKVYSLLKNCNSSVIITSHSPFIMDLGVTDESIYYAKNNNGTIIIKPDNYGDMMDEYQKPYEDLLYRGLL